jgi:hypothetical protein
VKKEIIINENVQQHNEHFLLPNMPRLTKKKTRHCSLTILKFDSLVINDILHTKIKPEAKTDLI